MTELTEAKFLRISSPPERPRWAEHPTADPGVHAFLHQWGEPPHHFEVYLGRPSSGGDSAVTSFATSRRDLAVAVFNACVREGVSALDSPPRYYAVALYLPGTSYHRVLRVIGRSEDEACKRAVSYASQDYTLWMDGPPPPGGPFLVDMCAVVDDAVVRRPLSDEGGGEADALES